MAEILGEGARIMPVGNVRLCLCRYRNGENVSPPPHDPVGLGEKPVSSDIDPVPLILHRAGDSADIQRILFDDNRVYIRTREEFERRRESRRPRTDNDRSLRHREVSIPREIACFISWGIPRRCNLIAKTHSKNLPTQSLAVRLDAMPEPTSHRSRNILISLIIFVAIIGVGAYWYSFVRGPPPPDGAGGKEKIEFVLNDKIENWQFKGLYSGNDGLEKKVQADIDRLNGLFGGAEFTDYILYISIAGQYEFLGDGAKVYEYLLRAIAEDSTKTGLAWYNLGTLLVRLGAFNDARVP